MIQRAVLLCQSSSIGKEHLIIKTNNNGAGVPKPVMTLKEMEKEMIVKTLRLTGGNKTKAAQQLGITVRTLRNKLNEYQLNM